MTRNTSILALALVGCGVQKTPGDRQTAPTTPVGALVGTPVGSPTSTGTSTTPQDSGCGTPARAEKTGIFTQSDATAEVLGLSGGPAVGYAVSRAGDVNEDGFEDLLIGSPYESSVGVNNGATYLMHGPLSGTVDVSAAAAVITGTAEGDQVGAITTHVGDVNGDGASDLLTQSAGYGLPGDHAGIVGLHFGPVSGPHKITDADILIQGENAFEGLGLDVGGLGDVDGDGTDDIAVGAAMVGPGHVGIWSAGLVPGLWSRSQADASFVGEPVGGSVAGDAVSGLGDADGDGLADALIGDRWFNDGAGAAYQVHAPFTGTTGLDLAAGSLYGDPNGNVYADNEFMATGLTSGDIDCDGLGEPIVESDTPHVVYLFDDGMAGPMSKSDATSRIRIGDSVGEGDIHSPGDVDGDGSDDLLVGSQTALSGDGLALLYYGPFSGELTEADAAARFEGPGQNDLIGASVGGGDFNGDGWIDLAIGALTASNGVQDTGAILLFDGF